MVRKRGRRSAAESIDELIAGVRKAIEQPSAASPSSGEEPILSPGEILCPSCGQAYAKQLSAAPRTKASERNGLCDRSSSAKHFGTSFRSDFLISRGPADRSRGPRMKTMGALLLNVLFVLAVLYTAFYVLRWLTGWRVSLPFGL
jgi:hypothetical protein